MGLFKKMIERGQAGALDYVAEIDKCLPAGETVLACAFGTHKAYDGKTGGRGIDAKLVNLATQKLSAHGHISGGEESCARAIPADLQGSYHMALSEQSLTFWFFGMMADEVPPRQLVSFPRSSVRSIVPTGKESRGMVDTRFTFTDDSHVDFSVYDMGNFATIAASI